MAASLSSDEQGLIERVNRLLRRKRLRIHDVIRSTYSSTETTYDRSRYFATILHRNVNSRLKSHSLVQKYCYELIIGSVTPMHEVEN